MTEERAEYKTSRDHLRGLVAGATEAEADPGRHHMEEAVLATVAKVKLADPALWQGFAALTWSRSDFAAIAAGIWTCILDAVAVHPDTVRARLPKEGLAVPDAVLSGILDGSKAVDVTVAREYIGTLTAQDKCRRAEAAGLPAQKCHPHALKHSLATHLIAGNVNLALVRQCLGHKAIGSTMKYVAVSDSQATEAAQAALMRLY